MFENVLGQPASLALISDIETGVLARAMLFQGPPASGKGTAALELGRVISCEAGYDKPGVSGTSAIAGKADWNCSCPACSRHRLLLHSDLLCLGPKSFSAEIAASAGTFIREALAPRETLAPREASKEATGPGRILFIRSVRKLLARFNPVLWEDDSRGAKVLPMANSLEESLNELASIKTSAMEESSLKKLADGIIKDAYKLESEGMSDTIPIGQLRRAAYWSRLAPEGRGKLLIIENADRMQDEARNSLLKLLEEPPARLHCVLASSRPGSLLPTIISRLRPYSFHSRGSAIEAEVIRRIFKDKAAAGADESGKTGISAYLDSFLPVKGAVLESLAAFFAASVAYKAILLSKKQGRPIPEKAVLLGKYASPKAEAAGFGRPKGEAGELIAIIIAKAENFEVHSLFSRFLEYILEHVSMSQKAETASSLLPGPLYNEMWLKNVNWAGRAVLTYRLRPAQVLEKLFTDLGRGMAGL